jgi:choline dehydrogenase
MELTPLGIVRHGFNFLVRGKGAATTPPMLALAFGKLSTESPRPDYELAFLPFGMAEVSETERSAKIHAGKLMDSPAVRIGAVCLHPKSRGTVTLRSAAPNDPPIVHLEMLGGSPDPRVRCLSALRRLRTSARSGRPDRRRLGAAYSTCVHSRVSPERYMQDGSGWGRSRRPGAHRTRRGRGSRR